MSAEKPVIKKREIKKNRKVNKLEKVLKRQGTEGKKKKL